MSISNKTSLFFNLSKVENRNPVQAPPTVTTHVDEYFGHMTPALTNEEALTTGQTTARISVVFFPKASFHDFI